MPRAMNYSAWGAPPYDESDHIGVDTHCLRWDQTLSAGGGDNLALCSIMGPRPL